MDVEVIGYTELIVWTLVVFVPFVLGYWYIHRS